MKKKKRVVIILGKKSLICAKKVKWNPPLRYFFSFTLSLHSGYGSYSTAFIQLNSKASSSSFQTLKLILLLYLHLKCWFRKRNKAYCWVLNKTLLFLLSSQDFQLMRGSEIGQGKNVTIKITAIEIRAMD